MHWEISSWGWGAAAKLALAKGPLWLLRAGLFLGLLALSWVAGTTPEFALASGVSLGT